jgi:Tol biopolymer transport system component
VAQFGCLGGSVESCHKLRIFYLEITPFMHPVLLIICLFLQEARYLGQSPPGMTPVVFAPGLVSLPDQHEFGSVFSRDGSTFYYGVDKNGKAETRCLKTGWTSPQVILSDSIFSFNDPMLSPDENRLYFISDKSPVAGKKKDYDIWYIQKEGAGWSAPINAGAAVNSGAHEYYVSFAKNGQLYFSSNRTPAGGFDIYTADGVRQPLPLDSNINTKNYEADVFVAPDESYLIFCATRPDGYGAGDLYISFKKEDNSWTPAKNMGETINTPGHELCPFVSGDGKFFFYTSRRDIYWVDARIIDQLKRTLWPAF